MRIRGYISALLLSIGGCLSLSAGMSWNTLSDVPYPAVSSSQTPKEASSPSASIESSISSVSGEITATSIQVPFAPADSSEIKYSVKKTVPLTLLDLRARPMDLRNPQNLTSEVEYNEASNCYVIHTRAGTQEVGVPLVLSPEEYAKWSLKRSVSDYYREKNRDLVKSNGEDFDFTNLKFDLGPAEKIFGKGGVQIKTKGSAELSMGLTSTTVDNPSLSERTRSTTAFDFDEKINLNVNGKVGDKMTMNLNYNTDATFDFDSKKIKLKYEGKEDEIVQLLEAGNVSMPSNNSLITGGSSLFGIRADLQFGKWKFQTVISQQETQTKTVSSKGGVQTTPFEISAADYDENRHFFLADYFRNTFNKNMSQLPNILSGITIKRVELWVTNKRANYDNPRNIVALSDLGEPAGNTVPYNRANSLYTDMMSTYAAARSISSVNTALQGHFDNGLDYEKVESARLLSSSEYTLNTALGYVSLKAALQADEVLGVAFEYTYMGQTYQVGELSTDITDNSQCLFVKLLKSTVNSPQFPNWNLMMKNVYSLSAYQVQKDNFKLDISYENDSTGAALTYLSEGNIAKQLLLRVMNLDRLDNNNKANPNGVFDFVSGYTVLTDNGRIIFPVTEPFGSWLRTKIGNDAIADKYCFEELYDSTKTYAKQLAEKNKFKLTGQYKASSGSEISLGATNVPRGSVVVTAGGVTLVENTDYTVNYTMGVVTIVNQSIIDAGTSVSVSLESNSTYSMQRKTMLGMNASYEASKNLTLGASIMHLSEKPLTTKVSMGEEPINNTIWGLNLAYKKESQWLTNVIDKLPFVNATAPSTLNLTTEFAQLIPGHSSGTQDNASYIDDFEDTELKIDLRTPSSWMLCSTPSRFSEADRSNDASYGYNRALLAWYYIDPLFTNKSSSLTPSHIKSDVNQLSNHYVREVYQSEVFPDKQTTYTESSTLNVLNLAYYPQERGPYNLDPSLNSNGTLPMPNKRWGGMMRKLDSPDFETANIEYIEFWVLDPFIYNPTSTGGDFYIDLGDVSEDILK
ncbi:MAG: cell surface protein SprA, partial [Bacteroidaceae bacterium]